MLMSYATEHLTLNILHSNDVEKVLAFYEKNKDYFEPWEPKREPAFYTLSYQRLTLSVEYNLILQSKLLRFWIFHQDDPHTIIGTVNFYNIIRGAYSTCQLGYKLDKEYTGNGYAKESILTAMEILHEHYNLHRIEANIMPSNSSSISLIQKLGFEYEGLSKASIQVNDKWESHARYSYVYES